MNDDFGLRGRAWVHMLAEGGRWSARELAMDIGGPVQLMHNELAKMYDAGSVARHERHDGPERFVTYSVNDQCHMPIKLTLGAIRKALRTAGETV